MAALFVWLWVVGGVPAAILGEVVRAENPRVARAARIAFALLLAVDLLLAALVFSTGQDVASIHMTRSLWWFTIVAAGVPLALVSGFAVRRGYTGRRRPALIAATLTTAALYVAFPLGFVSRSRPTLTGLGRWEHDHHLLGIAILLIPTLILLANELGRKHDVAPEPEADRVSLRDRIAVLPRRAVVGAAAVLVVLIWITGTNGPGLFLGLCVIVGGSAALLWHSHRSAVRNMQRSLRPPEQP